MSSSTLVLAYHIGRLYASTVFHQSTMRIMRLQWRTQKVFIGGFSFSDTG